eukprot:Sdes_comp19748_c0_seq1m11759
MEKRCTQPEDFCMKIEHQVNSFDVDCFGKYAVLAARKGLFIVDLEKLDQLPRTLPHNSKWEVVDVQWNPHQEFSSCIATTSNQKALVWNISDERYPLQHVLQAHTRSISDLHWSVFEKSTIATCSVDTLIHIWDIRDPRKPSSSFLTFASCGQVKWSRHAANILASSQGGNVTIWDTRVKSTAPATHITAHWTKIYGIDWGQNDPNSLLTCSQDKNVKIWDPRYPKLCLTTLQASGPVWRAKFTPFGEGLVTVSIPPPQRRSENDAVLWSLANLRGPVRIFSGHTDIIKEFQFRAAPCESSPCQLVTWSKDQTLRVWKIDALSKSTVCFEQARVAAGLSSSDEEALAGPTLGGEQQPMQPCQPSQQPQPQTNLSQEFSLVNLKVPNVVVEETLVGDTSCVVTATCGHLVVRFLACFPRNYPDKTPPAFELIAGTTIPAQMRQEVLLLLHQEALLQVAENRTCLEPCLKKLLQQLEIASKNGIMPFFPQDQRINAKDDSVPFPRFCGASFSGVGQLVFFSAFNPPKNSPDSRALKIPRSLDKLRLFLGEISLSTPASTSPPLAPASAASTCTSTGYVSGKGELKVELLCGHESQSKYFASQASPKGRARKPKFACKSSASAGFPFSHRLVVKILQSDTFLQMDALLAKRYRLNGSSIKSSCLHNAEMARMSGRLDVADCWRLIGHVLDCQVKNAPADQFALLTPFFCHPFSRPLMGDIIEYFIRIRDIQTLALFSCLLFTAAIQARFHILRGVRIPMLARKKKHIPSLSAPSPLSRAPFGGRSGEAGGDPFAVASFPGFDFDVNFLGVDPQLAFSMECFVRFYADFLYRLNELTLRCEIMQFIPEAPFQYSTLLMRSHCPECGTLLSGTDCVPCKRIAFTCSICRLGVRGISSFCLSCFHGGHVQHYREWFQHHQVCPTGCGCCCIFEADGSVPAADQRLQ